MTQLITTNNQQHVSNVTDDVGITLLHLSPNVVTLRSLLHLRAVITFRSSTHAPFLQSLKSEVTLETLAPAINWSLLRRCELDIHRSINTVRDEVIVVCWL